MELIYQWQKFQMQLTFEDQNKNMYSEYYMGVLNKIVHFCVYEYYILYLRIVTSIVDSDSYEFYDRE